MLSVWESWTYPLQLPLRREREYLRKPRIGNRQGLGMEGAQAEED